MRRSVWTVTAVVLVAATAAVADEPAGGSAEDSSSRRIEEIIVTAQKKEQSIQDVPISITALPGEFLVDAGVTDLHELAEFTPNVRFTRHVTVFIRGFGTPFSTGAFDPGVGLALDEMSIPRESYMTDAIFDVERFEVLRGPQGTLFGKNTPAGLFNVTTAEPTRELTGAILGRVGGLGVHRVEAAVGGPLGPLGDVARFRMAVIDEKQQEDVESTLLGAGFPGAKQRAGRLKLALGPFEGLDVLLIGSRAETVSGFTSYIQSHDLGSDNVAFLRDYDPEFEDDGYDHRNSINLPEVAVRDTELLQSNVRYSMGDLGMIRGLELVAVIGQTGFDLNLPFDADISPADILNLDPATEFDYDQRSAELRASGSLPAPFLGELESLFGVLLFESDLHSDHFLVAGEDIDEWATSPGAFTLVTGMPRPGGVGFPSIGEFADALGVPRPPTNQLDGDGARFLLDQDLTSIALFGNTSWHLTDRWTLSFGARITFEDKKVHAVNRCLDPGFLCPVLMVEEFDVRRSRSETDFSPKATLQYAPFEDLTLFVTRGEGFKSGGFNNLSFSLDAIEVDSESVVSWDLGAKGTLLDDALSYGATLFWMDAEDLQQQNVVGAVVQTRNAASARSRGIELDFHWLSRWEPLSIVGAAAFTDAKFKKYPGAVAPAGSGQDEQDLSGRRMPFVPRWQVNGTPAIDFPLPAVAWPLLGDFLPRDLVLTTAFDVLYRSNFFLDSDLDPRLLQKGYVFLDGRVRLAAASEAFSLGVAVKNITDERVAEFATDSILFPPGFVIFEEFQRNYSLEARIQW